MENINTILIVENDHAIQQAYSEMLYMEGYHIISSYTGEDGLKKLEKFFPSLMILDMELGAGITGLEVLSKLKRIDKNLPVIVVSGKVGMSDDPEITMSNNVYRFFTKPISVYELTKAVCNILHTGKTKKLKEINKATPTIGTRKIAGCVIEKFIDSGACGEVYKGTYLEKDVAIKILQKSMMSEENITRFQREALALAKIKHPNIIELLYTGKTENKDYYIIMSYFEGETIGSILCKENPFPEREGIEIITQIAEGLSEAHKHNLIHRDIKPSNILYSREQKKAKIIDFGLVRQQEANQTITNINHVLGTPLYMSPEQCIGKKLDCRSDIYSLGATFYHMLMGFSPFWRENIMQIMLAQVKDKLEWCDVNISPALKDIIGKMMEKKPSKRYSNMGEVAQDLKRLPSVSN